MALRFRLFSKKYYSKDVVLLAHLICLTCTKNDFLHFYSNFFVFVC